MILPTRSIQGFVCSELIECLSRLIAFWDLTFLLMGAKRPVQQVIMPHQFQPIRPRIPGRYSGPYLGAQSDVL